MRPALSLLYMLAVPGLIGWLVLHIVCGRARIAEELLGKIPTGLALGIGITGATTFLSLLVLGRITVLFELLVLAGLLFLAHRTEPEPMPRPPTSPTPRWALAVLAVASLAVVVFGATVWISRSMHEPNGAWDAWDFWNMRGRWFYRAPGDWARAFSEVPLWSHPSYPPLLSASVARGFAMVGSESVAVPRTIAAVFTVGSPLTLAWVLWRSRGALPAWIAALTLAAVPYFAIHGADQYADAPLSWFFMATFAFLALHEAVPRREGGFLMLAGLAASLAALTKNEGSLFVVSVVLARSVVAWRGGGRERWLHEGLRFAVGALPVGALVAVFKLGYSVMPRDGEFYVGPTPAFPHGPLEHVAYQASQLERWQGLAEQWGFQLTHMDMWWPVPLIYLLVPYALLMGRSPARPRQASRTMLIFFAFEALVVSGLFLAWSTLDIVVHMDALQRLLYQMLPSVLLAVFLALRGPLEEDEDA